MVVKVVDVVAFFHRVRDVISVAYTSARRRGTLAANTFNYRFENPPDFLGLGGPGDFVRPVLVWVWKR